MLKRVCVKNFKSLKSLDYHCAKLNILSGLNGAGKSSFIQLLLLLKEISAKTSLKDRAMKISGFGFEWKFADIKYCYASEEENVSVEATCSTRDLETAALAGLLLYGRELEEREAETLSLVIKPDAEGALEICYPLLPVREAIPTSRTIEKSAKEFRDLVCAHDMLAKTFYHFCMVNAFRIKPQEVHDRKVHDIGVGESRINPGGNDSIDYLYKFGKVFSLDSNNPMRHATTRTNAKSFLIDEVNAWLGEVSHGARINIEPFNPGDSQKYVESVHYGDGELHRSFKPYNVGFGISYILPVLVALLTAQPDDIVVIENPEAHLHPRGQSEMGKLLACAAASGVQLFVETHSDHVIGGIQVAVKERLLNPEDVNVAFFERKEHTLCDESVEIFAEVRNIKINSNGSLSEYPEDFLDEWNKQMMELMKP